VPIWPRWAWESPRSQVAVKRRSLRGASDAKCGGCGFEYGIEGGRTGTHARGDFRVGRLHAREWEASKSPSEWRRDVHCACRGVAPVFAVLFPAESGIELRRSCSVVSRSCSEHVVSLAARRALSPPLFRHAVIVEPGDERASRLLPEPISHGCLHVGIAAVYGTAGALLMFPRSSYRISSKSLSTSLLPQIDASVGAALPVLKANQGYSGPGLAPP